MIQTRRSIKEDSMSSHYGRRVLVLGLAMFALVLTAAAPAVAQRDYEPLFDKFSFKAELSWVKLSTEIRLDSSLAERGAVLTFEDDLGLGDQESVPTLAFEWQIKKRHRLAARWQSIGRDSSAQALEEFRFGDEVIPIDADVTLAFDTDQFFLDYTYYPWVKERWAAGFGIGLRVIDVATQLDWRFEDDQGEEGGVEAADVTGPLPYLYFEYRRLLSDKWRMNAGLGWLQVTIGDISGGQYIGRASFEYLIGKRWSVGGSLNLANINVDWEGIDNEDGEALLNGAFNMDVNDFSIFGRVRW
jgi:hypothetical protein